MKLFLELKIAITRITNTYGVEYLVKKSRTLSNRALNTIGILLQQRSNFCTGCSVFALLLDGYSSKVGLVAFVVAIIARFLYSDAAHYKKAVVFNRIAFWLSLARILIVVGCWLLVAFYMFVIRFRDSSSSKLERKQIYTIGEIINNIIGGDKLWIYYYNDY